MSSHGHKHPLKSAPSPVNTAIIMICEKCGKKLASPDVADHNPARELQQSLKHQVKEKFGKGVIRPVVTSCLDICPKDEVTVAIVKTDGGKQQAEFYTVAKDDLKHCEAHLLELALK